MRTQPATTVPERIPQRRRSAQRGAPRSHAGPRRAQPADLRTRVAAAFERIGRASDRASAYERCKRWYRARGIGAWTRALG